MKCTLSINCLFSLGIKVNYEKTKKYLKDVRNNHFEEKKAHLIMKSKENYPDRRICTVHHSILGCRLQYIPQFWGYSIDNYLDKVRHNTVL